MKRKGFTLVELAIVLVIIGIILGAILKGTELINNSKAKRLQNDLRGLEAAMWTFYDRFGRFPGDCDSNGIIGYGVAPGLTGAYLGFSNNPDPTTDYCGNATSESDVNLAFSDLRVQRILPTNSPNAVVARHNFNDYFAIGAPAIGGLNYNAIVVYGIPAWAAKMIDASIDGTVNGTSGRIRNFSSAANGTAWPDDSANDQAVTLVYYFDRVP